MIEGLEAALVQVGERAASALELALAQAVAGPARLVGLHTFKSGVHRLVLDCGDANRSVVVKRLGSTQAKRNELATSRWLPAAGLEGASPAVLGRAADPQGRLIWHVYEDVGDGVLATDPPSRAHVAAVAQLVARLHSRFLEHPLLLEARHLGGDLGLAFFAANVADALRCVRAVRARPWCVDRVRRALLDGLAGRLAGLEASLPVRREAFDAYAGPDTLLHGDLWTTNTFVTDGGRRACLIDWDRAAVGPASYDVSTFLMRFARGHRPWVLALYVDAIEGGRRRVRDVRALNLLFETAELSRYACHLGWQAFALLEHDDEGAWIGIAETARWFERLEPVVPEGPVVPEVGAGGGREA